MESSLGHNGQKALWREWDLGYIFFVYNLTVTKIWSPSLAQPAVSLPILCQMTITKNISTLDFLGSDGH